MDEQKVKNMLDPVDEQDAVNKRYLESQLQNYIKHNGQTPLSFNLNMNNYKIINLKNFDSNNTNDTDVPNIKYIKDTFLKLDGTTNMTANLNMDNNRLINLGDPNNDTDGVNKRYIDDRTKNKPSHSLKNSFKYVMDDLDEISSEYGLIVDKIDNLSWSFHSNKKVVFFKAIKDGSSYRYRLGFQVTPSSTKNHTLCIEQLFTNQSLWEKSQITISGSGVSLPYYKTTKYHYNIGSTEYYYTKTIVQFKK